MPLESSKKIEIYGVKVSVNSSLLVAPGKASYHFQLQIRLGRLRLTFVSLISYRL